MTTTISAPRPKPLQRGVLVGQGVPFGGWALALDESPAPKPPPPIPDVTAGGPWSGGAEWSEWACNRGYGFRSWWSWFWHRGEGLTDEEKGWAAHMRSAHSRECHQYKRVTYCYHRDPHVHPELRNVPTDKPVAKEGH